MKNNQTMFPKRVLHVVGQMNVGGQEVFIMNIFRRIDRTKVQFDFLVHVKEKAFFDDEIKESGGRIYYTVPKSKGFISNLVQTFVLLKKLWQTKEYTSIHFHTNSAIVFFDALIAKITGWSNIIVHSHSVKSSRGKIGDLLHVLLRPFLNLVVTTRFTNSSESGEWLFGKAHLMDVRTIKLGIEVEKYAFNPRKRNKIREELNVGDSIVLGHVGRFVKEKNHRFLVEVFSEFKLIHKKSKLLLVGEGLEMDSIRKQVIQLGLEQDVIFAGKRDDVYDLLNAMDIFVFPSVLEGLGISVIEAQASGLECLISKNIPNEVKLSELVIFKSLDIGPKEWSLELVHLADHVVDRLSFNSKVRNMGYDISTTTEILTSVYIERGQD